MRTLAPGEVVAGYRIERVLGVGRMGTVYLARHPRLPRRDALKILTPAFGADEALEARFRREAELAGRLDHPNIVAIYDHGSDGEKLWIAMQFVDGQDAAELLGTGHDKLTPERAVTIVAGAAHGLDEAHRVGLVHRDVKPANILIEYRPDGTDRALVADFGIARPTADSAEITAADSVRATLAYAAPEQIRGDALDHRADVYALGCTLYHLLTGTVPFPRESPAAVMHAQLTAPPPRPSRTDPAIPGALDAVVARAMAKDPNQRYQSCGELAKAATAALRTPASAARTFRGRRGQIVIAAGALLSAVAAVAALIGQPGSESGPTHGSMTPSVTPTTRSAWGNYGFIVDTFPELLPSTPSTVGYQGLRCKAADGNGNVVSTDATVPQPELFCIGDGNPVLALVVQCNADRSPFAGLERKDGDDGEEAWTRPSGTGRSTWGLAPAVADGTRLGTMEIRFDGTRSSCTVKLTGASSGSELRDRWWPAAPL
ncbi:serine/threonine-protein kinase [Nocardia sp. CDC160]|uniref:serine/threonine-protein kinase n=1 Tax=Nocardia sp. CDC160 TaxID=3112166 RepID=UPI002DBCFCDC|nr:serine/threonine-protein kinase [Nocardia sp. CDC160]MEC3917975.1 serine/threonine-protein kinase [Nocardia sp. CDC160]